MPRMCAACSTVTRSIDGSSLRLLTVTDRIAVPTRARIEPQDVVSGQGLAPTLARAAEALRSHPRSPHSLQAQRLRTALRALVSYYECGMAKRQVHLLQAGFLFLDPC